MFFFGLVVHNRNHNLPYKHSVLVLLLFCCCCCCYCYCYCCSNYFIHKYCITQEVRYRFQFFFFFCFMYFVLITICPIEIFTAINTARSIYLHTSTHWIQFFLKFLQNPTTAILYYNISIERCTEQRNTRTRKSFEFPTKL